MAAYLTPSPALYSGSHASPPDAPRPCLVAARPARDRSAGLRRTEWQGDRCGNAPARRDRPGQRSGGGRGAAAGRSRHPDGHPAQRPALLRAAPPGAAAAGRAAPGGQRRLGAGDRAASGAWPTSSSTWPSTAPACFKKQRDGRLHREGGHALRPARQRQHLVRRDHLHASRSPPTTRRCWTRALLILQQIAGDVSFDPAGGRHASGGVMIEEWRLGRGAGQRMLEKILPVLFKGSRYAERLPIGKKEILERATAAGPAGVLPALVPPRSDGGDRGGRLRRGHGRGTCDQAASAPCQPRRGRRRAARVPGARPRGDAGGGGQGQGDARHLGRRVLQAAPPGASLPGATTAATWSRRCTTA